MKELTIAATVENIETVTDFVNEQLEEMDCPMKAQMQISIAIDELFGNIAHYAYPESNGDMSLCIGFDEGSRTVTFRMTDQGIPFDPLKKPDPDITLSAEEREIGGLGIFIARKTMDTLSYCYENEENKENRLATRLV